MNIIKVIKNMSNSQNTEDRSPVVDNSFKLPELMVIHNYPVFDGSVVQ